MTVHFKLSHLSFQYKTTTDTETGKKNTVVDFFALHGTPEPFHKARGIAGEITYQPEDDERGFVAPIWLAVPAKPSHPTFARVAFFSEEACELFLKSQILEALVSEDI